MGVPKICVFIYSIFTFCSELLTLMLTTDPTSIFNLEQGIMKVLLMVSTATVVQVERALFHLNKSEHTFVH